MMEIMAHPPPKVNKPILKNVANSCQAVRHFRAVVVVFRSIGAAKLLIPHEIAKNLA